MDQIVIAENCVNLGDGTVAFQSPQNPRLKRICSHDLDLAPRYLARGEQEYEDVTVFAVFSEIWFL